MTASLLSTYDANGNAGFSTVARTSSIIDLREGHTSSTHGMTDNIGITIENAVGTRAAVWVDLEYAVTEVWTMDRSDLTGGTWREIANLDVLPEPEPEPLEATFLDGSNDVLV